MLSHLAKKDHQLSSLYRVDKFVLYPARWSRNFHRKCVDIVTEQVPRTRRDK